MTSVTYNFCTTSFVSQLCYLAIQFVLVYNFFGIFNYKRTDIVQCSWATISHYTPAEKKNILIYLPEVFLSHIYYFISNSRCPT